MAGYQKKHENTDFIDLQQGGIIYFTGSQNTYLQILVLAAIMYMEKRRKCFQSVVLSISTNTVKQPEAVKLEEALQNTDPHLCPAGISYRGIASTKAWLWRSLTCVKFCTWQNPGRLHILVTVFSGRCSLFVLHHNFCRVSSRGQRALQWAPALPSCFGVA